jgi:hypothetical protein
MEIDLGVGGNSNAISESELDFYYPVFLEGSKKRMLNVEISRDFRIGRA